MGRQKAAVFPLPVTELANTSLPDIIAGIACCYTKVGISNSKSSSALSSGLQSPSFYQFNSFTLAF